MKVIYKDVFREIKNAPGRFVSLLLIVILGVAFYAGIRSSGPDMKISADVIYDKYNLSDIRVMSTLGITEGDIAAISKVEGVDKVIGAYSYDFLCKKGEESNVIQARSITDGINEISIVEGRLPQKTNECVIQKNSLGILNIKIGDKIKLVSGDGKDIEDTLSQTEFTIVGTYQAPDHISFEMGTTSIGNGSIDAIIMVLPQAFSMEVFTEADVLVKGAKELSSYSDEYDACIDRVIQNIEAISEDRIQKRHDEIVDAANEELDKAKKEYEKGEKQYQDSLAQWEAGKAQLDEAKASYAAGQAEIAAGKLEIESRKPELDAAEKELQAKQAEFAAGEAEYNAALQEFYVQKAEGEQKINQALAECQQVEEAINNIVGPDRLIRIRAVIRAITGRDTPLEEYYAYVEQQCAEGQAQIDAAQAQLDAVGAQLEAGRIQLQEAQVQLDDAKAQMAAAEARIANGEVELSNAKVAITEGEAEVASGKKELDKAKAQLDDAKQQIDDAEKQISKLERAQWYVLDRTYLSDFLSYRNDSDRIDNIGKVFPVVFFIVAALVCLTAMTRMVDEERTQIGTLKALGYSKLMIMRKYIVYALMATIAGSVIGALVGGKVLPSIIINVYKILYPNLSIIVIKYNLEHSIVAGIASLVCIIGATLFACTKSLLEVPASLMRPVTPKIAKKLLLERFPNIWSKIQFNWKNALRNFVRYKKRLVMTLFGICGSTALLLVGFGLKDAINTILYAQFGEINLYDEMMTMDPDATDRNKEELKITMEDDDRIASYSYVYENLLDMESENSDEHLSGYIYVPKEPDNISETISLRERIGKKELTLNDDSVIVTEKMAKILNVNIGDSITITQEIEKKKIEKTVVISGIAENYIYHYVYMTPVLYEELFGQSPEYNAVEVVNNREIEVDTKAFSEEYLSCGAISGIRIVSELKEEFAKTLNGLNSITLILIICAGALTFVVLYNLNNINISERRRELATLKVLGFYDVELSQYIYRENVLITIIGIIIGVVAGIFLNKFVVTTVEVDVVMFGRQIFFASFVKSVLIAVAFTAIVNVIVHFKLKKIDMATSLKSVE